MLYRQLTNYTPPSQATIEVESSSDAKMGCISVEIDPEWRGIHHQPRTPRIALDVRGPPRSIMK